MTEIKARNNLQQILHLLGDRTRYNIFRILSNQEGLCVSEIANKLNISVPAASQHFRVMENAGLVKKKREGQRMCYLIDDSDMITKTIIKLMTFLFKYIDLWFLSRDVSELVKGLVERSPSGKVAVLINEYDAPITNNLMTIRLGFCQQEHHTRFFPANERLDW